MIRQFIRVSSLSLALLVGACGGGGGSGNTGPTMVAVPNVVGAAQAAASTLLTSDGLVVGTVTMQNSSTVAIGGVISENPAAGTSVATGSAVALVVSSGPVQVTVPNVVGMTQAAADTAINGASLSLGNVLPATSLTVPSGSVISQNPAAGATVNAGSAVALTVSVGPPVPVPNVVGMTQSSATSLITAATLVVGPISSQASVSVPPGSVISQNPQAGTGVATGTAVSLVVSLGPPVNVPPVVGLTQSAAASAIGGAGLVVGTVTMQSSPTVASGSVISENPSAGTSVNPGSAVNLVVSSGPAPANTLAVTIDSGPAALAGTQVDVNMLFTTVTICTPGSTTACQTIDHVQVDTGSVGLQILAEALNGSAAPTPISVSGSSTQLQECVQFADGYSWGSMVRADVTIGPRTLSNLPVHLIGNASAGTAPSSCTMGSGGKTLPPENTLAQFGANGIIGIGYFLQDCGSFCASNAPSGLYYSCASGTCTSTIVPVTDQLQNPVGALSTDNNGVIVDLPAVTAPGVATLSGTVYFGVSTQPNNSIGAAAIYTVDSSGDLRTFYNNTQYASSFIDSGSNGYFFSSSIPQCTTNKGFYCPPSPPLAQSAQIQGQNNAMAVVNFNVDNADTDFQSGTLTALPNIAGTNGSFVGITGAFDWGLPFFFGRKVYVLFENDPAGPASAF